VDDLFLWANGSLVYDAVMCGRFTLKRVERVKFEKVDLRQYILSQPRYNIAPSQPVWAITQSREQRQITEFQWGLIPSWSDKPAGIINARAESIEEKPSFSESFRRRRCLIPADGFYEWEKLGKAVQPHFFQLKSGEPFMFAGIWDRWTRNGPTINSCAIITTNANELLSEIHHRMPVILDSESYDEWLQTNARVEDLLTLLTPFPSSAMQGHTVAQKVNDAKVDEASLVEPTAPGEGLAQPLLF
jgi:putative SOS response-associated peptidase YedK